MQNNVDISTREDSLNVKYGMINFGVERDLARTSVKYIYTDLCDIRKNFIRLGFHLDEFERNEYYKDFGYASIAEFADVNLGMDKSAVSRYINVFRFCAAVQEGGSKRLMYIDDKYKDYSFSQLSEMVSMPLDKVSKVKPDMSIKQIRELKKAGKAVAMSQPEKPDNLFDINTYEKYNGIVQSNYVKNSDAADNVVLEIHDKNGKRVPNFNNIWVDLMHSSRNKIVIRLYREEKEG